MNVVRPRNMDYCSGDVRLEHMKYQAIEKE